MRKSMLTALCAALMLTAAACGEGNANRPLSPSEADAAQSANPGTGSPPAAGPSSPDSAAAPTPAPDPNKKSTVAIAMYGFDAYYEDAKKAYEAQHPNTKIEVRYAAKEFDPSGLLVEKFRTKTAADFLAGKGADLIVMDDLPADHYVGQHLLVNLSEMMNGDPSFRKADYFQNVLDNAKQSDGNVYALPLSFTVSGVLADEDVLRDSGARFDDGSWTWEQFSGIVQKLPLTGRYKYGYFEKAKPNLLWRLVTSSYSQYVDQVNRKASFDSEAFIGLLNGINRLEADKTVTFDGKNYMNVYFQATEVYSLADYRMRLDESQLAHPKLYQSPKSEGQQAGGYYAPHANIAINASTDAKPEAWDFLKFLMSGEGRTSDKEQADASWYSAFPVSKPAYEARTAAAAQEGLLSQAEIQPLTDYIAKAANPIVMLPDEIELLLFQETPAFFSGQKSAEAVAKLMQNKATTYLNE